MSVKDLDPRSASEKWSRDQASNSETPPAREPRWLGTFKRIGIVVGCVGGLLGGSKTGADIVRDIRSAPNLSFLVTPELTLFWNGGSRILSVDSGVRFKNDGTAVGHAQQPTAKLRYRRSTGELILIPLAHVSLTVDGFDANFPFSVKPGVEPSLAMQARTTLTVDQVKEIITEPQKFEFLVNVASTRNATKSYCFWIEKSTFQDLIQRGELRVMKDVPTDSCFDVDG